MKKLIHLLAIYILSFKDSFPLLERSQISLNARKYFGSTLRIHFAYGLFAFMLTACTQPFDEDSYDFERSIVVDGLITDEYKNHHILLNSTTPIGETGAPPIMGANVWVEDNEGSKINFFETAPGTYFSEIQFSAEPGKFYQLFFVLEGNHRYQSNQIELIKSPPIDSIYDMYAEIAPEGEIQNVGGIQFFLDSYDATGKAKYFRYEWQEDYKIKTPLKSRYTYFNPFYTDFDSIAVHGDTLDICYAHDYSKTILIANTLGSSKSRIVDFPVRFVSGQKDLLRNRYSLFVRQYAISKEAYNYYRRFKEMNESGGSLFDSQQGTVTGNITALDDPTETVLGYFEVSGVSELRAFFNYHDLDPRFDLPSFRYDCSDYNIINRARDSLPFYSPPLRILRVNKGRVYMAPQNCTDCTGYASNQKPDFWTD